MPIIVQGISLPVEAGEKEAEAAAVKRCGLGGYKGVRASVWKRSVDARRGGVKLVYSIKLELSDARRESEAVSRIGLNEVRYVANEPYSPEIGGEAAVSNARPVIAGFGPAGMFAALTLAEAGYRPLVLERGGDMRSRDAAVDGFLTGRVLDPECNIQFGEGGAGTYSDGKLLTRVSDPRCEHVLRTFARFGAPGEILESAHPHVGTDALKPVVTAIRERITALGGEVRFNTRVTGIISSSDGRVTGVRTSGGDETCSALILATGHSARDTWLALASDGVAMERKAFAAGFRVEHLRSEIDAALLGKYAGDPRVGAAEYRLAYKPDKSAADAVFTFCMCPGGTVVAAASETGGVVTNGMSFHARDGRNSNSAVVAAIPAERFPGTGVFAGVELQREIERRAFDAAGRDYRAPAQTLGGYLDGRLDPFGRVEPSYPAGVTLCGVEELFPSFITGMTRDAFRYFDRRIKGFASPDAVLTAPETRTSSSVRIPRGEDMYAVGTPGLIPCGEGAGYAGGITSAAVDGLHAAEAVMRDYRPLD